ncbi:response regulator [Spirosoma pulveris]
MVSTPQIYIVDDAADYRLILQQVFSRFFPTYSVALFADGNGCLETLSRLNQLPDLMVLDRHMPGLDGHQLLLHLKTHPTYRKIPIVMMSAAASIEEINDCYEAGANSFLGKPMELDLLREQLGLICHYWLETNRKPTVLM